MTYANEGRCAAVEDVGLSDKEDSEEQRRGAVILCEEESRADSFHRGVCFTVQAEFKSKGVSHGRRKGVVLFAGKIKCAECGGKFL